MRIRTLPVTRYRSCPIYIRHFADHFEYLVVARSQIFTDNVRVRPPLIGRVLHFLRLQGSPYSDEVLAKVNVILTGKARERINHIHSEAYDQELKKVERERREIDK